MYFNCDFFYKNREKYSGNSFQFVVRVFTFHISNHGRKLFSLIPSLKTENCDCKLFSNGDCLLKIILPVFGRNCRSLIFRVHGYPKFLIRFSVFKKSLKPKHICIVGFVWNHFYEFKIFEKAIF
jgi:hypothetical protein